MTKLTLKANESGNFVVFRALAECPTFREALKRVEEYNEKHPEHRILSTPQLKNALKESYRQFGEAKRKAFRAEENPDYDNPQVLDRLKNVLCQQLPKNSYEELGSFEGISMKQADIGHILVTHAEKIGRYGTGYYAEQRREAQKVEHEQATVHSYRPLGKSYGSGKVFSGKRTYQTNREALFARDYGGRR